MAQSFGPKSSANSGNIFFALFGAIALIGILGAGVMTFMKGPLATSVKLTRQNTAENQMNIAGQVAVMASAANGDCETVADGFVEPVEWRDAGALGHPTDGGLIPLTIGVSKKDPWGTEYGYCGWDHGASNSATDAGCGGAGQKRLSGTNSTAFPVVAMVSAGPDKVFTTTCRSFLTADVNADGDLNTVGVDLPLVSKAAETDDDLIFTYTYEEATGASGGLWSLKSGDASTATINKDIEVSGTGTFDRIGATGSDYLEMLSGLKLPNPSVMSVCNATNAGVMRLNASATGIEICDGVSAWNEVTGSGGGGGSGSALWLSPNVSSGMNVANGNPTCVSGTCYGSNVTFTLTNNLDPAAASAVLAVTLSNTTDFEKVSDNCHGNSIAAAATCQIVVRAKASGNRSYSAILSITGNNSPLATLDGTASGFGCTVGGNGPGGKYAGCGVSGYDLIITPSGCTATTNNPVCAGGSDTTTKAGANGGSTAWLNAAAGFWGTGLQNTVNQMAYSGGGFSFPAAEWCSALQYGGYDDWYLPSSSELAAYFCPNKVALGYTVAGVYITSTGGTYYSGINNYWTSLETSTCTQNNAYMSASLMYIRCMRKDPPVAFPSPTSDTVPVTVTFNPSSSTTAAETRTSNTVTVEGVSRLRSRFRFRGEAGHSIRKTGGLIPLPPPR
jgi:type II secretory pathway pseudopilin PulG